MNAKTIRNQMSSSKFLKGTDIGNATVPVIISNIEEGKQQDGKPQLIISFEGKEKMLGLNVGNTDTLITLFGEETNDWIGKQIFLFTVHTKNQQGQSVLGIRVKGEEVDLENITF